MKPAPEDIAGSSARPTGGLTTRPVEPRHYGCRIVTHEAVERGILYAVGPCTCKGEDPECPRCAGAGIFAVKAKGVTL